MYHIWQQINKFNVLDILFLFKQSSVTLSFIANSRTYGFRPAFVYTGGFSAALTHLVEDRNLKLRKRRENVFTEKPEASNTFLIKWKFIYDSF